MRLLRVMRLHCKNIKGLQQKRIRTVTLFVFLLMLLQAYAFKLDFSLTGYLTYDINQGVYDNFPMAYWTITFPEPVSNLTLKLTDYITYTHGTFNLMGFNLIVPRYYFFDYKLDLQGWRITLQSGRFRMTRSLTQNFESVRLGGFKFDTYDTRNQTPLTIGGLGGYASYKMGDFIYEFGGAYSIDQNKFALYGLLNMNFKALGLGKLGLYYENRYNNLSVNYSHQIKTDFGQVNFWTGLAASQENLLEPSFILGATLKSGKLTANAQFVYIGANKYDVEFGSGEPSNPNSPYSWNLMAEIGYDLGQIYFSGFLKHNSRWMENGWFPLYGVRFKVSDLMLSLGNGDLNSSLLGVQNLLFQLTYSYKTSVDFAELLNNILSMSSVLVEKQPEKLPSGQSQQIASAEISNILPIAQIYNLPEGSKVTVKGIILAPVGLLNANTTYLNDETAGIMLYGRSIPTNLSVGDVVEVKGTTKIYNGILEIVVDSIDIIGNDKVNPKEVTTLSNDLISNLVTIFGKVKSVSKDTLILENDDGETKVYVKASTGIRLNESLVGKTISVTGIVSLFKGEFELLPRFQEDIKIE